MRVNELIHENKKLKARNAELIEISQQQHMLSLQYHKLQDRARLLGFDRVPKKTFSPEWCDEFFFWAQEKREEQMKTALLASETMRQYQTIMLEAANKDASEAETKTVLEKFITGIFKTSKKRRRK